MTFSEQHTTIIDACQVAIVATIGKGGMPNVSATWFERDGDTIRLSIAESNVKAANLARDARGTLFFIDPNTGLRSVEIRGNFGVAEDPEMSDAKRIGSRMGDDLTRYIDEGEGRLTATIRPTDVNVFDAT